VTRPARNLALLGFLLLPAAAPAQQQFPVVGAEHVKAWIDGKRRMTLVDSRTPEEYAQAHLPGSISIPADRTLAEAGRLPRDKGQLVVFYCRGMGCTLSHASAAAAARLGHTYLLIYQAGMPDWLLQGYPVERGWGPSPAVRSGPAR